MAVKPPTPPPEKDDDGMFSTPNSVKALRRYYRTIIGPDINYIAAEFKGESDRSIVILLGSILDDVLKYRISQSLAFPTDEKQFEYIFRFEGPLGTFSARVEIAYFFGLIDELTRSQLDDIREMRNACAHSKHEINFGVPELATVAKRLFYPRGTAAQTQNTPKTIRHAFMTECTIIQLVLMRGGSREEAGEYLAKCMAESRRHASKKPDEPSPSPGKQPER